MPKKKRTSNKAVLYARYSPRPAKKKDETGPGCESCEAQIDVMKKYCEANALEVVRIYKDKGLTGANTDRPGFQKTLRYACKHKTVLMVYSLSRMSRSTKETIEIAEQLEKAEADLCSTSEKIDTSTYMGRFFFRLLAILAEMEREQISERTRDAMRRYQASGRRMSARIPYGWMQDPKDPARIIANRYEQKVIKRMIELRKEGVVLAAICDKLADEGFKPRKVRRGGKLVPGKWDASVIHRILEREINARHSA